MKNKEIKTTPDESENNGLPFEVVESSIEGGEKVRHKGVYLLPNLLTTAALFSAFYSIIASTQGRYEVAALSIFIALVFDGFDGRIARLTNTQSEFGAEYDSLSDLMAFGLAPALLAYHWGLIQLGKVGWMISFIYVACTALRLARFNVQIGKVDKKYFIGLPSPTAASLVAALIWFCVDRNWSLEVVQIPVALMVVSAGFLMVTNFKYSSFKEVDLAGRVPFFAILIMVFSFALIFIDPPLWLSLFCLIYAFGNPVVRLGAMLKSLKKNKTRNPQ